MTLITLHFYHIISLPKRFRNTFNSIHLNAYRFTNRFINTLKIAFISTHIITQIVSSTKHVITALYINILNSAEYNLGFNRGKCCSLAHL